LAFARWLTRPHHPLTARVAVNRLWKHHFGEGLVRTLENFGRAGEPPSHPELLDWLAVEFTSTGWSLKGMHRLMMTSATYRQSSRITPQGAQLDPENRLLSRAPLRRLDAESLRDSLVALAGRLNPQQFGPADPIADRPDGLVTSVAAGGMYRRSIYVQHRRTLALTVLADFDRPAMSPNCTVRSESIVAPQALHLMNNQQIHDLSESFAARVLEEAGNDWGRQIDRCHWLAYGRAPAPDEREAALATLDDLRSEWLRKLAESADGGREAAQQAARRALTNYCHAIVNSARFIFVD
jgi:hypothetical protein